LISELLEEAATIKDSGFTYIEKINGFSFYKKNINENKRFLIICETTHLENVNFYNNTIQNKTSYLMKLKMSQLSSVTLILLSYSR